MSLLNYCTALLRFCSPDYTFPYLVIIVSVISNAVHFAIKLNQVRVETLLTLETMIQSNFILFSFFSLSR
jgi:hypothetical protein